MDGVEILAIEEVVIKTAFNWTMFWIIFGMVFVILVAIGIFVSASSRRWDDLVIFVVAGIVIGAAFGGMIGDSLSIPVAYENQYQVTVSDEVSMNDFVDKYEIIDQKGKIYTVRERE